MELLELLIPQKLDEVRKIIELRRSAGMEAASAQLLANHAGDPMDDIRRVVRNMIAEERRHIGEQTAAQRKSFANSLIIFGIVLLLDLALIWFIAFRVRREQENIRTLNQDLERRVALRTEALQRSNDDLQQFAYVASHDLKEPLRMVSSYSTLLQRKYQGRLDPDADTYIGFITGGVRRMDALISDLLEYSRAGEASGGSLGLVDTETVMKNVLSNLKVTISESQAIVRVGRLPPVTFEPMWLTQIFQNLIGNAIKYRGERAPEIDIAARMSEKETIFSVKDNGIGIDARDKDKIFGIFKRLHGNEYEGTGIGLAMVKKIIDRQGGRIWVESLPGSGSTFYFSVLHSAHVAAESTSA
jgi:light-regulated signal transduction histidine kinase (bacteriophytochrome)